MQTNEILNAQSWERAWKEDPNATGYKMKRAGIDPTHGFDHKAVAFNEEVFSAKGRVRSKRIINWIEAQGVTLDHASILDVGAASGGFTIPFANLGARVTAVEPCFPLADLLIQNLAQESLIPSARKDNVELVTEPFEDLDLEARGWKNTFDLVFVSMCPTIVDWASVERVLSCARQFCYISLGAGEREHSLFNEVMPLLRDEPVPANFSDMGYLLQLLYLKGYSYTSLITKELKTTEVSITAAVQEVMENLQHWHLPAEEHTQKIIVDYLQRTYPSGTVVIRQGGRFGKVLVQLQDQQMYMRK